MLFNSMEIGAKILLGEVVRVSYLFFFFLTSICENVFATETVFQGAKFYKTLDGTLRSQFSKNYALSILLA